MSAWDDLISFYRGYGERSDAIKIATLAQWMLESGRGNSELARTYLNFGGLKFRERMVGFADPVDYRASDGDLTTYCKFSSVAAFVRGYWHFIESGPYDGYEEFADDGAGYIRHIAKHGYSADAGYVSKVLSLFEEAGRALALEQAPPLAAPPAVNTRLAIVVGHNRKAPGASAVAPLNTTEFAFNGKVADAMKREAWHYNLAAEIFIREPSSSYTAEITDVYRRVKEWGADCSLELHFNSADSPTASRSQVLCRRDSLDARSLAQACCASVVDLLRLKDGGVVQVDPSDRGGGALYAIDGLPSVLCEPFFGSNSSDCVRVATVGEDALALAYLRGVRDWRVAKVS